MGELLQNEAFFTGVIVGINLFQERILEMHRRGLPLMIEGDLFYLQTGQEKLQETIDKICQ